MNRTERFARLTCTESVRKDIRGKSVRAATFTVAAAVGDFVIRIGSTALLARLVLPEQFGLVMMVTAVTAIADQFRDLGLSAATIQRRKITHQEITNLFWINTFAGVIIASIISGASPLISAYYKEPRVVAIMCTLSLNFVFGGLLVQHQALLTRQLRLGHTSSIRLLSSFFSTCVAIALAWFGFGFWALVWREVSRSLLLAIGMWLFMPWIPGLPSRKTSVRGLVSFGAHLSAANIVACISSSVDRILIGRFWGPVPVGLYRQAYQLLVVPMEQLLGPMFQVTQPGLSMLQTDHSRYRRFYQKVLTIVCIASMPLSLFVTVCSSEITRIVLGRKWLGGAEVLTILSLGTFIKSPVGWSGHVLITRGQSKRYLGLTLFQNLTLIVFMLIGVQWGIVGVAFADVAATYLLASPILYYSFKDSPVTVGAFVTTITRPAIASVVMAIILKIMHQALPPLGAPIFLMLGAIIGSTTFLGVWVLLPGGRTEISALVADLRCALDRKDAANKSVEPALAIN